MKKTMTCGEATIRLLGKYGVDTLFGIPGVHTLDFYRGLSDGGVQHVQARNEQGAGFMADGYARVSGRPGVALVISGPGVTNALTAIGQAWADSIPVLLLSAETSTETHGRGWGALHEIPDQKAVSEPLTAFSARARRPQDVPEMIARAFSIFASERPRPVHISVPIDVQAMPVTETWYPVTLPTRPEPNRALVEEAASLLAAAHRPLIMTGGGATGAAVEITMLADRLNAIVVSSTAGKGVVAESHPLSLGGSTVRPEVQEVIGTCDVVLAIGTELAETDSFVDRLPIAERLIRVDLDPRKINDLYPAEVGIVADARPTAELLLEVLDSHESPIDRDAVESEMEGIRQAIVRNLTESERRHSVLLEGLRAGLSDDVIFMGDICQLVYTGAFGMPVEHPKLWHYPAGFCTLGCALPNAIGAKLALHDRDVVCLAGDGGVMFTVQELIVAVELGLPIPVVIWENGGLKQIQDDMKARDIPLVGVTGRNPDFLGLGEALGAWSVRAESLEHAVQTVNGAFRSDGPTVITVQEVDSWLS